MGYGLKFSSLLKANIYKHYDDNPMLSISGPVIHIDRYNSKMESNETLYHGFLKVIFGFYFLDEYDTFLRD
jgi:hypothetical protein